MDLWQLPQTGRDIDRVHYQALGVEDFEQKYEIPSRPLVLQGIREDFFDSTQWTFEALKEAFGHCRLHVGDDDNGKSVRMPFSAFLLYLSAQKDDSPLYLFDDDFGERAESSVLVKTYSVPPFFQEDIFEQSPEDKRPPYRWLLVGPKRSGTSLHKDPLGTSAWNLVLHGAKWWVCFPPHIDKQRLDPKLADEEAITWFLDYLPTLREEFKGEGMIEFVQYEGETVFVPGMWWHAVLNLEDTIAVAQNYASTANWPVVWTKTRRSRRKLARTLLSTLDKTRPDLAAVAREIGEPELVV